MAPAEPASAAPEGDHGHARLRVEVVYCPRPGPGECDVVVLDLPAGATVADALGQSGLPARYGWSVEGLRVGVWCKLREPGHVLRDLDRVEIYRPLTVDPKEARRLRYKRSRTATRPA